MIIFRPELLFSQIKMYHMIRTILQIIQNTQGSQPDVV